LGKGKTLFSLALDCMEEVGAVGSCLHFPYPSPVYPCYLGFSGNSITNLWSLPQVVTAREMGRQGWPWSVPWGVWGGWGVSRQGNFHRRGEAEGWSRSSTALNKELSADRGAYFTTWFAWNLGTVGQVRWDRCVAG
jgi:hypothetical protein